MEEPGDRSGLVATADPDESAHLEEVGDVRDAGLRAFVGLAELVGVEDRGVVQSLGVSAAVGGGVGGAHVVVPPFVDPVIDELCAPSTRRHRRA